MNLVQLIKNDIINHFVNNIKDNTPNATFAT